MLVLSRKVNESIIIGGNIRVTMSAILGRQVRLAIQAPPDVPIVRAELLRAPTAVQAERGRLLDVSRRARRMRPHRLRAARPGR
jgi:carbon storage regulator CsrA